MRLEESQVQSILDVIESIDPDAEIWLYGSRAIDEFRGGDIDLLVLSDLVTWSQRIDLLVELKLKLGDQKIDLQVRKSSARNEDVLTRAVLPTAIRLNP